jgi:type I restriction enzyme M protein
MKPEHRQIIVDALLNFVESDICKIYNREYFYYNKQGIKLYETNNDGVSVKDTVCTDGALKITVESLMIDGELFPSLKGLDSNKVNALFQAWNNKKSYIVYTTDKNQYSVSDDGSIIKTDNDGTTENLGCGEFALKKGSISKKTGLMNVSASIVPIVNNDYEIIPHHFDEETNTAETAAFMSEYIYKPFEYGKNEVGVEINFNKEFYVPETLESVEDLMSGIAAIDEQIKPISL